MADNAHAAIAAPVTMRIQPQIYSSKPFCSISSLASVLAVSLTTIYNSFTLMISHAFIDDDIDSLFLQELASMTC